MRKYKKYIPILLVILFLMCISYFVIFLYYNKNNFLNNSIYNEELFSKYKKYIENEDITIATRKIIKNKEKYEVFIGKNQKEIENGYYDIYINLNNNIGNIYVNKLFKEYQGNIYDKNYLIEIVNYINYIFDMNLQEDEKKNFINNIEIYYSNLRKINTDKKYCLENVNMYINKFNITFEINNNMLKIVLSKR